MSASGRAVQLSTVVYAPPWSDAAGWERLDQYSTIQAADVDGDGKCELLGRSPSGLETWAFDPSTASWQAVSTGGCEFTDGNGWNAPQYYVTIHTADIDGDGQAEILGRGPDGIETWKFDPVARQWNQVSTGACGFSDGNGWDQAPYFMTIQAADIDGDGQAEVMGRGKYGVDTWKYDPNAKQWNAISIGTFGFTDANGWNQPQYFQTIQAADIDGDGQAEVMGRGPDGIDTWKYDPVAKQWNSLSTASCGFSDVNGWNQPELYPTIQAADVDGDDQAEVLGRGTNGVNVWKFDPTAKQWNAINLDGAGFTDANGWGQPQYYLTIKCADVDADGQAEMLGRFTPGVETLKFNAEMTTWQPVVPLVTADARLMENYVAASPISSAGTFVTTVNGDGRPEVFSIGTDGQVYELYPDPSSDTGWSQLAVGVSATQLAAGLTDEGRLVVFAATGTALSYVLEQPGQSATRWVAPEPVGQTASPIFSVAAGRVLGHLYLGVLVGATAGSQVTYQEYFGQWNSASPGLGGPSGPMSPQPATQPVTLVVANNSGAPDVPLLWTFTGTDLYSLPVQPSDAASAAPAVHAGTPGEATILDAAAAMLSGRTDLFAVFSDGNLYGWSDNNEWVLNISGQPLEAIASVVNPEGQPELFAVGQDKRLFHVKEGVSDTGFVMADLGVPASSVATAVDGDGNPAAFVAGPGSGNLVQVWRAPDTGDWSNASVAVQALGQVQRVVTYTAELTIRDELGQARPAESVSIGSSGLALVTVNGVAAWIDAERPMTATSDPRGKVSVTMETTSLSSPLLNVTTGFMAPGSAMVVEPNGMVQGRLRSVTAEDLQTPTDFYGNPLPTALLGPPYNTDTAAATIADTITQSMTLLPPQTGTSSGAHLSPRIDLARVPEQHWRLEVGSDGPIFRTLTAEEARTRIVQHRAALAAGSFLGIDWGDAWEAVWSSAGDIASQATGLLDLTVSAVADGISVAVSWVIDGLTSAYNGIITLAEEVFDIVEGIFATVGTAFEQLVEWLGFLFDWDDIVRTAHAFSYLYDDSLTLLPGLLTWTQTELDNAIQSFGSELAQLFNNMATSMAGRHDAVTLATSAGPPPPELAFSHGNNVLLTGLLNGADAAVPVSLTASAVDTSPLDELIQQLDGYAAQFQTGDGFTNALNFFTEMAQQLPTNPDQALRLALAGTLEVLGAIAQLALETARLVVNTVLGTLTAVITAMTAALQFEWEIPFVSQLYQYVTDTNEPLTPIGLMALIAAVPATVLTKLTTGAAPFADDTALQTFETTFTAQAALAALPSSAPAPGAAVARAPATDLTTDAVPIPAPALQVIYHLGLTANTLFYSLSAPVDWVSVPIRPLPATTFETVASSVVFGFELVGLMCTCPAWSLKPRKPMEYVAYAIGAGVPVGVDGVWVAIARRVPQLNDDTGVAISFLVGLVSLAMPIIWVGVGGCSPLRLTSGLLAPFPSILKLLRLRSIEFASIGTVPVRPWNRVALCGADVAFGVSASVIAFAASELELKHDAAELAAGAVA